MPGLATGRLDRPIVLQVATAVQSESGEVTYDWANALAYNIFAEWIPGSTREGLEAQRQIESHIDGVYKIHYRPEPKPDESRILGHDGRLYDVKPAIEIGRKAGWMVPVVARGEL